MRLARPFVALGFVALALGCGNTPIGTDAGGGLGGASDAGGGAGGNGGSDAVQDHPSDVSAVDAAGEPGSGMCGGMTSGACATDSCQCCPAGGPTVRCDCSTSCASDADCKTASRPKCNRPDGPGETRLGFCTATDFMCCWYCK